MEQPDEELEENNSSAGLNGPCSSLNGPQVSGSHYSGALAGGRRSGGGGGGCFNERCSRPDPVGGGTHLSRFQTVTSPPSYHNLNNSQGVPKILQGLVPDGLRTDVSASLMSLHKQVFVLYFCVLHLLPPAA